VAQHSLWSRAPCQLRMHPYPHGSLRFSAYATHPPRGYPTAVLPEAPLAPLARQGPPPVQTNPDRRAPNAAGRRLTHPLTQSTPPALRATTHPDKRPPCQRSTHMQRTACGRGHRDSQWVVEWVAYARSAPRSRSLGGRHARCRAGRGRSDEMRSHCGGAPAGAAPNRQPHCRRCLSISLELN